MKKPVRNKLLLVSLLLATFAGVHLYASPQASAENVATSTKQFLKGSCRDYVPSTYTLTVGYVNGYVNSNDSGINASGNGNLYFAGHLCSGAPSGKTPASGHSVKNVYLKFTANGKVYTIGNPNPSLNIDINRTSVPLSTTLTSDTTPATNDSNDPRRTAIGSSNSYDGYAAINFHLPVPPHTCGILEIGFTAYAYYPDYKESAPSYNYNPICTDYSESPPQGTMTLTCSGNNFHYKIINVDDANSASTPHVQAGLLDRSEFGALPYDTGRRITETLLPAEGDISYSDYQRFYKDSVLVSLVDDIKADGSPGDTYVTDFKDWPPCDAAPSANVVTACTDTQAVKVTGATDPDVSTKVLRVDVYEDGPAGTGKRVYSSYTDSAGSLTATWAQIKAAYKDPSAPAGNSASNTQMQPGTYPSWASHGLWVYVIGLEPGGTAKDTASEGANTVYSQTVPVCAQITCGTNVISFAEPEMVAGVPNKFRVHVKVLNADVEPPSTADFGVKVDGTTLSGATYDNDGADGVQSTKDDLVSNWVDFTPTAGIYNITWGWTYPGIAATANGAPPYTCTTPVTVGNAPFFTVTGGDTLAGACFGAYSPVSGQTGPPADAAACESASADAGVKSWNADNASWAGAKNYFGAGSQYAVIARGDILSFVTTSNSAGGLSAVGALTVPVSPAITNKPYNLAYANTGITPSPTDNGMYGGKSGKMVDKVDDYFGQNYSVADANTHTGVTTVTAGDGFSADGGPGTFAPNTSKVASYTGNLTINGGTLSGARRLTIVVKGNVFIAGDINYSYGDAASIPKLKIIANNGIYVSGTVGELHGTYISQGNGPAGGLNSFVSCADRISAMLTTEYTGCNKRLDIYGTVIAEKLLLNRTWGSVGDTSSTPSETFHYSPELWLSDTNGEQCTVTCNYRVITALPPLL